jgi:hypothetical protein
MHSARMHMSGCHVNGHEQRKHEMQQGHTTKKPRTDQQASTTFLMLWQGKVNG